MICSTDLVSSSPSAVCLLVAVTPKEDRYSRSGLRTLSKDAKKV